MLLPGPESVNGCLYGLPLLLSPSPHSAMCHFQVSSHCCWCVEFFCHRLLADYGPPIAAARPLICHGPPIPPPHAAAQVQSLSWVPVRPPICCCLHRHTLCHVPLSGLLTHCWCVPFFV
ncbi:unnamed protein product, partial [Staurois parvus]